MTSFLRKQALVETPGAPAGPAAAGEWSSSFPALAEFLGAVSWSDGTARLPGTLTLFTDEGVWKICLSDKDQSLIAFCSGLTPLEAFQAAERGLVTGSLDWRSSRPRGSNKRK